MTMPSSADPVAGCSACCFRSERKRRTIFQAPKFSLDLSCGSEGGSTTDARQRSRRGSPNLAALRR